MGTMENQPNLYAGDIVMKAIPTLANEETDNELHEVDHVEAYQKGKIKIGALVKVSGEIDTDDEPYTTSDEEYDSERETYRVSSPARTATNNEDQANIAWFGNINPSFNERKEELVLIDRPVFFGEIVASANNSLGPSGVVIKSRMKIDILLVDGSIVRGVDTEDIMPIRRFRPGQWVLSTHGNAWLGRIEEIQELVVLEFSNEAVFELRNEGPESSDVKILDEPSWIKQADCLKESCFYPGQKIQIKRKRLFHRGKWLRGSIQTDEAIPNAVVREVRSSALYMRWFMPVPAYSNSIRQTSIPPSDYIPADAVVPLAFDGFSLTDWCVGDLCLYKSDPNQHENVEEDEDHKPQNQVMSILCTHTICDVQWQDGKIDEGILGKDLVALRHFDDSDFWPNDFVMIKVEKDLLSNEEVKNTVKKSGVILSVNFRARTAIVQWRITTDEPEKFILGEKEEVSLYALESHPEYGHYHIGSMVFQLDKDRAGRRWKEKVKDANSSSLLENSEYLPAAAIFGQIIGINEGKLQVAWADGSQSREYPSGLFCIDKDDLDSMVSEDDDYDDYDDYYYSDSEEASSWETMSQSGEVVHNRSHSSSSYSSYSTYSNGANEANQEERELVDIIRQINTEEEAKKEFKNYQRLQDQTHKIEEKEKEQGDESASPEITKPEVQNPTSSQATTGKSFFSRLGFLSSLMRTFQIGTNTEVSHKENKHRTIKEPVKSRGLVDIIGADETMKNTRTRISSNSSDRSNGPSPKRNQNSPAPMPSDSRDKLGVDNSPSTSNVSEDDHTSNPLPNGDKTEIILHELAQNIPRFETLSEVVADHYFLERNIGSVSSGLQKSILKEWQILRKGLPNGIWVQCYENRMDLMRAAITGSVGTPYHYALFFFDIYIPSDFPASPPELYYRSHGLRLNPNLYENGRLCLSLLNTWTGRGTEKWKPYHSSVLQILVSIQGLVLVPKPYFNEAGYDKQCGTLLGERNSVLYNESAYLLTLKNVINIIKRPPISYEMLVKEHFTAFRDLILQGMEDYENNMTVGKSGVKSESIENDTDMNADTELDLGLTPSDGFKIMLAQIKPRVISTLSSLLD